MLTTRRSTRFSLLSFSSPGSAIKFSPSKSIILIQYKSTTVIAHTGTFTVFPALIWIVGVAPCSVWFTIWISAVVVISETFSRKIFLYSRMTTCIELKKEIYDLHWRFSSLLTRVGTDWTKIDIYNPKLRWNEIHDSHRR